jgi:hypothetical protein
MNALRPLTEAVRADAYSMNALRPLKEAVHSSQRTTALRARAYADSGTNPPGARQAVRLPGPVAVRPVCAFRLLAVKRDSHTHSRHVGAAHLGRVWAGVGRMSRSAPHTDTLLTVFLMTSLA